VENAPAEITPEATVVPPVRAARTHVTARASRHAPIAQPSENFSDRAFVPPAEIVPVQPAPLDTSMAPPVITPSPDAPTLSVPEQPAQTVPVQPAPQP
jgi:hypothetical protein